MSEKKRSEDQSKSKICDFPSDSESEDLKTLVNNPSYICSECGKSAARGENLCSPERMFSSW